MYNSEARQYLSRKDVQDELKNFAEKRRNDCEGRALAELRKSIPSVSVAAAHAAAASVFSELLGQLNHYLIEE